MTDKSVARDTRIARPSAVSACTRVKHFRSRGLHPLRAKALYTHTLTISPPARMARWGRWGRWGLRKGRAFFLFALRRFCPKMGDLTNASNLILYPLTYSAFVSAFARKARLGRSGGTPSETFREIPLTNPFHIVYQPFCVFIPLFSVV